MAGQHALLAPSSAEKWMGCPGSLLMEKDEPDQGSAYADEGTAAHHLAATCLASLKNTDQFLHNKIEVYSDGMTMFGTGDPSPGKNLDGRTFSTFEVDHDMANHVQAYLDTVRGYAAEGNLFIEQRLPISTWTGEPDAHGTSDAVVLTSDGELIVVDLKYGMGELVAPERNKQLMIYALGAYEEFSLVGDIKTVRLVIMQPRISHVAQEWPVSVEELLSFGEDVKASAFHARNVYSLENENTVAYHLMPSEAACRWCRAKAKCPKLAAKVAEAIGMEFEDITPGTAQAVVNIEPAGAGPTLATKMAACDLIEKWIKAVRGKVEAELFAGHEVPGYKLVMGKKGARQWADLTEAEQTLKSMRLKVEEMYDMKVISPTSAEKIFGDNGSQPSVKRWNKLQSIITRSEGKPSVAPASDKRPAYAPAPVADSFDDVTGEDMA